MLEILLEKYNRLTDYTILSDLARANAAKTFKDTLAKTWDNQRRVTVYSGALNIEAFHRAYDKDLAALNIYDTLFNRDGLLRGKHLYGQLKDLQTQNKELSKALIDFWAAQFKENLTVIDTDNSTPVNSEAAATTGKATIISRPEYSTYGATADKTGKLVFFVYHLAELNKFYIAASVKGDFTWVKNSGDEVNFDTAKLVCIRGVTINKTGTESQIAYDSQFEDGLGIAQERAQASATIGAAVTPMKVTKSAKDLGLDRGVKIYQPKA